MKIAIIGLGKMGQQFVDKLIDGDHQVIAFDKSQDSVNRAVQKGSIAATSPEDVISKFGGDSLVVWLMIPASVVEDEVARWHKILPKRSILIDGGNSNFKQSQTRAEELAASEIRFLDVGTSGGVLGAENGFSLMVGGPKDAYDEVVPILNSLAKPSGAQNYFGPSGSGHFIKMIHNSIEYGLMESLAEGYDMLKNGPIKDLDLAKVAQVWQHGSIVESSLNGLVEQVMDEDPSLNGIEGIVAQTGETEWTLEIAKEANVNVPAIKASFDVRINSENGQVSYATKLLAALRNKFGGHSENPK